MRMDIKYNFCSFLGETCSLCKLSTVVSYDYDNEKEEVKNVIFKCENVKDNHKELSTCEYFKCNRIGEYCRCSSCKQGMEEYIKTYRRDLEEDYTDRKK